MSGVGGRKSKVREEVHRAFRSDASSMGLLMQARKYYDNLRGFREMRGRCKRYYFGDAWSDRIVVDGESMSEEDYISRNGNIPLQNNLIRRLGRNVIGVYRDQNKEPVCVARDRDEMHLGDTMSTLLQYNWQLNSMSELNARSFEDFLIGGLVVHRKGYGWRGDRCDCWTRAVNPNRVFFDTSVEDMRFWDVSMIGEVHDMTFNSLCGEFARGPGEYSALKGLYASACSKDYLSGEFERFGFRNVDGLDFLVPDDPSVCRVIEVWYKEPRARYHCHDWLKGELFKIEASERAELVDAVNAERMAAYGRNGVTDVSEMALVDCEWFIDEVWVYKYLSPTGAVLKEGESPYMHKSHPYVVKAYPMLDGEIHSFVDDLLDQQRYVNRLVTMYDWIMRSSAKGVLMFPEDCVPDGMSMEDIADEWTRFNGMIVYRAKPGVPAPHQVSSNSTNIGISELLNLQLKFFEDISGVHGSLQGKPGNSNVSGVLYAQQAVNSTKSLLDLLESFSDFVRQCAEKDVKNIQQYYTADKVMKIAGRRSSGVTVDVNDVLNADYDLSISENTTTPAYRQVANDFLIQIWRSGQISLDTMLEVGSFPFGDELLQKIKADDKDAEADVSAAGLQFQDQ